MSSANPTAPATTAPRLRNPQSAIRTQLAEGLREFGRLALLPSLISFVMLWPALLNLGVLAPTDIVAYDPLTGGFPPGNTRPLAENPVLGDVVDSFVPWKLYMRSELEAGRFPLWNPYNLLGTHLHANLQSGFFSPFTLLWFILPPLWGFGAVTFLKWTLAGLGMALLLRRLGLGMRPAVFGSVAFQLSGPIVGWLQWPIADGLVWVPWLLWAALGWLDTRRPGWLFGLTFFIAAEITAAHIETTFHSLLFLALFALAGWWASEWIGRARWGALGGLALCALLGLMLGAVQILPFLSVLTESFQWAVRSGVSTADISMPPHAALMWLTPNGWGWPDGFLLPSISNWPEGNPYVGALTLLLAAGFLAVWIRGREWRGTEGRWTSRLASAMSPRKPLFWLLTALVSASMAYGVPPLGYLRMLPGFSSSINSRLISVVGPCVIVLAAMGLERLLQGEWKAISKWWGWVLGAVGVVGVPFFLAGLEAWWVDGTQANTYSRSWQMWAAALFCAGTVLVLARLLKWVGPRRFATLALGLLLLDMVRADWNYNPTAHFSTFYPSNALTDFLASHGPTERVAVVGPYAQANMLLPYNIPDFRSYDATHPNHAVEFARIMSPETFRIRVLGYRIHLILVRPSAVHMASVGINRVAVPVNEAPENWQEPPAGGPVYTLEMRSHDFWVWRNNYARPFTYLASRFRTAPTEEIEERRVRALTLDRVDEAQVFDPEGVFPPDVAGTHTGAPITEQEGSSVRLESYVPGEIRVSVNAEARRLLIVNEQHTKDWRVTVDGEPAPLLRVNYLAQGVVVPPGPHTVRFYYDPPSFKLGAGLSLLGLVGWLGLGGWAIWKRPEKLKTEV
jgi:hypothetical protein